MKRIVAAFAAAILSIGIAHAAKPACDAGTLDTTYGVDGTVDLFPYAANELGLSIANEGMVLDHKDRAVVIVNDAIDSNGTIGVALLRLTDKGELDKKFGAGGLNVLQRFTPGTTGPGNTSLAEDSSGRILVSIVINGYQGSNLPLAPYPAILTVFRLLEDGQLDPSFGDGGKTIIGGVNLIFPLHGIRADADGRVLIAFGAMNGVTRRMETSVLRLTSNGALDSTFGNGGTVQAALPTMGPDRATDVHVQTDGRIVVIGRTRTSVNPVEWDYFAMRFLSDGTVDESFGNAGHSIISFGNGISALGRKGKLQSDGKLVIVGPVFDSPTYGGWARLNTDGSLDSSFGNGGRTMARIGTYGSTLVSLDIQADGKLVGSIAENIDANGGSAAGVLRLNPDGTLDTAYGGDGAASFVPAGYSWGGAEYIRIDSKNRPVFTMSYDSLTGTSGFMIARFKAGTPGLCK